MRLISHRGNINRKYERFENEPGYIQSAIDRGYDVEIDLWVKNDTLYLGHDEPQYKILPEFLLDRYDKLWIHCKNLEALNFLSDGYYDFELNYFWHQEDDYTITSGGFIWAYPGRKIGKNTIACMPELNEPDNLENAFGICSDFIKKYEKSYSKIS